MAARYAYPVGQFVKKWMMLGLNGSVGQGGVNYSNDVSLVQTLLNLVPSEKGGPAEKLVVDGSAGTKTKDAIGKFQTKKGISVDRRIDVGHRTIQELMAVAGNYTLPTGFPALAPAGTLLSYGLDQLFPPAGTSGSLFGAPTIRASGWRMKSVSTPPYNGTQVDCTIQVENVTTKQVRSLQFSGTGGNVPIANLLPGYVFSFPSPSPRSTA